MKLHGTWATVVGAVIGLLACQEAPPRRTDPGPAPRDADDASAEATAGAPGERPLRLVFLGDSLTAGLGLGEEEAYPSRLEEKLLEAGYRVRVVNAGVSGDTTAGGLARLDWLLRQQPDVLVVALGANDGLRGLPLEATEENLRAIVARCRAAGARVLLAGQRIPPNYGPDYTERFAALFPRLAEELEIPLVPFLLEGVAAEPDLNLPDGIHPNAAGHQEIAENVLPYLETVLSTLGSAKE